MPELLQILLFVIPVWLGSIAVTLLSDRIALLKRRQMSFASPRLESIMGLFLVALTTSVWVSLKFVLAPLLQVFHAEWPNYSAAHMMVQVFFYVIGFVPFAVVLLLRRQSVATLGFSRHNLPPSVLLGIILSGVTVVTYLMAYGKAPITFNGLTSYHLYYLVAMLSVGFVEEAIYRGYLQLRLTAWHGARFGWVLTAIVFAISHVGQSFLTQIFTFIWGLLFGWIMWKSENIVGLSIWHAIIDWVDIL